MGNATGCTYQVNHAKVVLLIATAALQTPAFRTDVYRALLPMVRFWTVLIVLPLATFVPELSAQIVTTETLVPSTAATAKASFRTLKSRVLTTTLALLTTATRRPENVFTCLSLATVYHVRWETMPLVTLSKTTQVQTA
ncbi:MAG: hypothetical protein BWX66_01426 [Deltaproteobacteria bacterium ADurb.Bin058]|nr:MAG: hypothetical protein BWX66_01426 [Deltaproteobacteria bacterium ADurb.Bin058]